MSLFQKYNVLISKHGALTDFTVAGKDQFFVEAKARIEGNSVVVWGEHVQVPVAIHFAWTNAAQPNLFNNEGLPTSIFHTNDWRLISSSK